MGAPDVMKNEARSLGAQLRERTKLKNKFLRLQFATSNKVYVMLTSVYVP